MVIVVCSLVYKFKPEWWKKDSNTKEAGVASTEEVAKAMGWDKPPEELVEFTVDCPHCKWHKKVPPSISIEMYNEILRSHIQEAHPNLKQKTDSDNGQRVTA